MASKVNYIEFGNLFHHTLRTGLLQNLCLPGYYLIKRLFIFNDFNKGYDLLLNARQVGVPGVEGMVTRRSRESSVEVMFNLKFL